jgi:Domain of unknown function (DUF4920)
MLQPTMARLLTVLLALSAPVALAHDEKGECPHDSATQASNASPRLKPGEVLRRGAPLPKDGKPVPLARVLSAPKDGQVVLVEGVIRRACEHKGCWMELAPTGGGEGVRVTFKDYGFFVPTDSAGAVARVAGTIKVSTLTAEQAEHLRSEGAQAKSGREVQLVASGVELRRPES